MKNKLKITILFVLLAVLTLGVTSTFCYATEADPTTQITEGIENPENIEDENILESMEHIENEDNPEELEDIQNLEIFQCATDPEEQVEIKLNRKVQFTGETYWTSNGKASIFSKAVRKEYTEEKPGCGIIGIILPNREFGIYIIGEGWISKAQVKASTKYIKIEFNKLDNGFKSVLKVDGEYVNIVSDNPAIVTYEDGAITAGVQEGKTTVKITTPEGKEIDALVINNDAGITLNLPEKTISADMGINANIVDKITIDADAYSETSLYIENGAIGIRNTTEGNLNVNDTEIATVSTETDVAGAITGEGLDISVTGNQNLTLLQRIAMNINERLATKINSEGLNDPTVDLNVNAFDKDIINVENKTIPVFTTLKTLLSKLTSI